MHLETFITSPNAASMEYQDHKRDSSSSFLMDMKDNHDTSNVRRMIIDRTDPAEESCTTRHDPVQGTLLHARSTSRLEEMSSTESCMAQFRDLTRKARILIHRCCRWLEGQLEKFCVSKWAQAHVTFYRLHLSYFVGLALFGALIFWLPHKSSQRGISGVDAIFTSTSILTLTGLMTIRMADLSTGQKLFSLILMTLGSHAFTSLLPLYVRRYYFHRHQKQLAANSLGDWPGKIHGNGMVVAQKESPGRQVQTLSASLVHASGANDGCEDDKTDATSRTCDALDQNRSVTVSENAKYEELQHVPPSPVVIPLTNEHKSLVTLCKLVPTYIIIVQLVAFALNELYIAANPKAQKILQIRNINSLFFSFFTSVSAFTNSGVPLHDDNLVPFQRQHFLLLLYTIVSLAGNLLYPLCLRLVIRICHRIAPEDRKPVFRYLLEHPRKCYTHLFPARQTVWLALTVLGFTVIQLIFFCSLDWHSVALKGLDSVSKVIAGVYQSVSVRNSGGAVVAVSGLAPTMLVLYVFMMYIAAYPIFLLRQNSSEYDEKDIAVYQESELTDNSLTFQARKLLAKDSAYLCIILFIICVIEGEKIQKDPLNFSIFNIIFEVVSAYGGVGMSVGYSCALRLSNSSPCVDVPYSFSGTWSAAGKIILSVVMLMGRHRGLPDEIDCAIKLPSFGDQSLLINRKAHMTLPPTVILAV